MSEAKEDFLFIFQAVKHGALIVNEFELKPKVLVAVGAESIGNAFKEAFGENVGVGMCAAHMRRNVMKTIELLVHKDNRSVIKNDIEKLQIIGSSEAFSVGVDLFIKKREGSEDKFLEYFMTYWIHKNANWYEGYRHFTPSTNNCLESFNRVIKDEHTLRERFMISRFKIVLSEMLSKWSLAYKNGLKSIISTPTITLPIWTSAYQWVKEKKEVKLIENESLQRYYLPAKGLNRVTSEDIELYNSLTQETFDEYIFVQSTVWTLEYFGANWKVSTCSRPYFFKNYICKHSVGIAIRNALVKPPPEAKTIALGQKRKRGRSSKAKKAFLMQ